MRYKIKLLVCTLSILWSINSYSQTKDSLDFKFYIKSITNDSSSRFFYPKLTEKVKNHPSELNVEDVFYLYYGQIFQKGYKSLSFIANPERPDFDKAVMNGNCKKALNIGGKILERNPVDLTVLLHVCNCIKQKGVADTTNFYEQRFKNLLTAIFSTGDGKSMKTAIGIVSMEDDYILKGILGFLGGVESLGFENNHAYSVWEKNGKKLYFEDIMTVE
jgi:Domain of unknown function (DUF4919)